MTIKTSAWLAALTMILVLLWGLYGGMHYGWLATAPFSWLMVSYIITLSNAIAWLNLLFRIYIHVKKDTHE